jgi:lipoate-protein ligase A
MCSVPTADALNRLLEKRDFSFSFPFLAVYKLLIESTKNTTETTIVIYWYIRGVVVIGREIKTHSEKERASELAFVLLRWESKKPN